jgi:hypothetical protein
MNTLNKEDKDDFIKIVESMKQPETRVSEIILKKNTLHKCVLCKKYLSSQKWSIVMENHIKNLFGITQKKNNMSGDGVSNDKNVEIKVSLGDSNGGINFVQIRPGHDIDYYIFLIYDINIGKYGSLFWICLSSDELYSLLPEYGCYAHGTVRQHGKITLDNIYNKNNNLEYAIRCNSKKNKTKKYKTWKCLTKYLKTENEIVRMLA